MGTVETMMMQTCVLLALCAAAQAAMPWTASLTKLNSAEFTSLASIGMTSSEWNQPTSGTSFPSSGVIQTNQGGYYVDTKETFHRPVDMSVELYQTSGSNECGVVALFPQNTNRHSSYNAGVGWWASYFGAGVDGSLKYTVSNNNYQSGIIRLGNNCRNFQYRNLVVTTNTDAPTSPPTLTPTENPTTKPPSPSPSHTPTEVPTRHPTTPVPSPAPSMLPTIAPTSVLSNCHCSGCHNHYARNEHVEKDATSCAAWCNTEGNKCAFSLFDSSTTKCYLYSETVIRNNHITVLPKSSATHGKYTCYTKVHLTHNESIAEA